MNTLLIYTTSFILALLASLLLIPRILYISAKKRILDIPNARKTHKRISSRLGGVAFFPSLFISICTAFALCNLTGITLTSHTTHWLILSLGAGFLMYTIGISDDIKGVRYSTKFKFQILASLVIIASGSWINNLYGLFNLHAIPFWIGIPLTIGFVLFVTNSINLIDGIDGLSSGLSSIALLFYGAILANHHQLLPAILAFSMGGAILGFFRYNFWGFPRRSTKMFMGDAGTLFVGTIISLLALKLLHVDTQNGSTHSQTEILTAYSVLIVPCFDVLRVMLHRLKRRQPLFIADRNHIHHKLMRVGFSTQQTLLLLLGFSVGITFTNLLLNRVISIEYIILFDTIVWTVLNLIISKKRQLES